MIFLHPPLEGFDHIFAEHFPLGSGLIAAARTVIECSIFTHAVEVTRHCAFKTCCGSVGCMVIDNIQYYSEACLVKGLHHLLELFDSRNGIVWVC